MENLKPGLAGRFELKVTREYCTSRGGPFVFATPAMLLFVERSAHALVEPHLGEGRNSVGVTASLRHLAPTLEGQTVRAEIELTGVDRRRLTFKARVFDEIEQIGELDHERFVIDTDKAAERLKAKAAAAGIKLDG